MSEHNRARARVLYSANALINSGKKQLVHGVVRDISIDAMYLACDPDFEVGEKVKVEIVLLGKDSELIIKAPAKVARTDDKGIALSFLNPLEWWPIFSLFPLHQLDNHNLVIAT